MASATFTAYDRNLRRMHMLNLVEQLHEAQTGGFRASLVINSRTGLPIGCAPTPRPRPMLDAKPQSSAA